MNDRDKSKEQLIAENDALRQRVAESECRDLQRRDSDKALRESESRYRALAESTRDIIYILDRQGTLLYANRAASQYIGIPAADLAGKRQTELFPPEMARAHIERIERVFATGEPREGDTLYHFGPEQVWLRTHLFPLRDDAGQISSVMGVCHNITDRKRAEEALQKSNDELDQRVKERTEKLQEANERLRREIEERRHAEDSLRESEGKYRTVVETSPDAVLLVDLQGRVTFASQRVAEMYGADDVAELLGKNPLEFFAAEDHPRFHAYLQETLSTGVTRNVHYTLLRKDGSRFLCEASAAAIRDAAGQPTAIVAIVRDITERMHAEETLRDTEFRFQAFMNNGPALAWMKDEQGRYTFVNKSFENRFGIRLQDWRGKADSELWPRETAEQFRRNDREVIRGNEVKELVEETLEPDKGRCHWRVFKFPFQDTSGQRYVGGVAIEITEQKRVEESLRQSNDELQAIYDGMFDGLMILDAETKCLVKANAAICHMLGYSESELLLMSVSDLHSAEELPRAIERIEARAGGMLLDHAETWMLRKGGGLLCVDVVGSCLIYGGRPCVAAFFRDISERRRAEEDLRASEERFRVAFEEAPVGIVMAVADGIVTRVNRTFCQMTGYAEEDLVGRSIYDFTHPDEREHCAGLGRKLELGEIANYELEKRYLHKDGTVFWAHVAVTAVRDGDGQVAFALGIIENITERKEAQRAVERERLSLRRMLQASDRERQLIAYDIHDGLAQELAGAIMQFENIATSRETIEIDNASALDTGLTMLRKSHAEARRLISGVRPPILDESGVVAAVAHLVFDPVFDKGPKIALRNRVRFKRLAPILENVIYRIVQEGLANARNHSCSDRIVVGLIQKGERLQIKIRDWGVGFDPKSIQFNRYGIEGIRQRARVLGGTCSIESKPGKGTRIIVELPVLEREEAGSP